MTDNTQELDELRELLMPLIELEILTSGFLSEHDKNVGGTLYTPENNQKLTASAIADVLSVKLQQAITAYTNKREPTDKEIEDLFIAYKCRGIQDSKVAGITLTKAVKEMRKLFNKTEVKSE